jgi:Fe(3+) dicitrate transport protein
VLFCHSIVKSPTFSSSRKCIFLIAQIKIVIALQFCVLIEDEMRKSMLLICAGLMSQCFAQSNANQPDSLPKEHKRLAEITIVGLGSKSDIHQLPEIVGTSIYAGKKNALILMDNVKANVSTNTMRQVMAKVPGIHVWESDGSGIQIGVAARGLSPNRSWEFNVRQNGYDISADPYGYPEAYYNPQLQAVQRIEIIRGHGSLQYGPQFGGMINYILRNGNEINKPFEVETQQTVGSFGMFNTYNAIGGETKNFHYYAYFDHRRADGWRDNSGYYTNSGFGTFTWRVSKKLSLTAEIMKNHINSQQPGGHTDLSFKADAQQSFRARNWMDISWFTTALIMNYQLAENRKINVKVFRVAGDRNSVGYMRALNIADTINASTGVYNPRAVDIDQYRNFGVRGALPRRLHLAWHAQFIVGRCQVLPRQYVPVPGWCWHYRVRLHPGKNQYTCGRGTLITRRIMWPHLRRTSSGSPRSSWWCRALRYEWINAAATGINGYVNGQPMFLQNQQRQRGFLLAGIGAEYHTTDKTEFYANITQAYRPMQFADLTAPPTTNEIDANLQDAKGYNADIGFRGRVQGWLYFDASAFYPGSTITGLGPSSSKGPMAAFTT